MNSINVFGKTSIKIHKKRIKILSRFPIVAACVLRWIEFRIFDPSYFKLDQGTTPVHLIIIDEVYHIKNLLQNSIRMFF
jgi:beta-lactamase regulating signal transducer with metallopeptidase domain